MKCAATGFNNIGKDVAICVSFPPEQRSPPERQPDKVILAGIILAGVGRV